MAKNGSGKKPDSYDRLKQHGGKSYSGMPIGRSHKWLYDQGEWRERKVSLDEWEIFYQTPKRRTAKAPKGSGAPIGTEYNWLIVSHQRVDKLDENVYMTRMEGKKFKVAHKRASKDKWSASERTQRKHVIQYLQQVIDELQSLDEQDALAERDPFTVGEHERIYGLTLRTKAELTDMARELKITGTSKMKRQELLEAVQQRLAEIDQSKKGASQRSEKSETREQTPPQPAKGDGLARLAEKTKTDLYRMASAREISGRSEMNKAQLVNALKREMGQESRPSL
ncbi:hypothetical protein F6455_04865 [Proteobacteria bacterium 005FR1]|nr:hypothetical protein [Proteobacteria bacterium 005FR1]